MCSLAGLVQVEFGPADNDFVTVPYEIFDKVLEIEKSRTTVDQSDIVDREARLQRSVFEQGVQHDIRIRILFQTYDHTDSVLHSGLVIDVCNTLNLLVFNKFGNLFNHLLLVDHVWNLSHHDGLTSRFANLYFSL